MTFLLNDETIQLKINPATVLLDFLRKVKHLKGTKEVCKEGDCGACAVLIGELIDDEVKYKSINSCLYPIQKVNGKHIVTIEGLNQDELSPVQNSFIEEGASQCGFCTPGFIISTTGYLINTKKFNSEEAINSIAGNICRCTGYNSIRKATNSLDKLDLSGSLDSLVENKIVPSYFMKIKDRLNELNNSRISDSKTAQNIIVSGGTDLFVQKPEEMLDSEVSFLNEYLQPSIIEKGNSIIFGGTTTIEQLNNYFSQKTSNLSKLFRLFASLPIRNSATIAGNIVNASPIADISITLLALNTELVLNNSKDQKRNLRLDELFLGYKSLNKESDEIIESIIIKNIDAKTKFNFEKVSKRTHLDIASVNSAIMLQIDNDTISGAQLSAGGVSPIPLYLSKTSQFLMGKSVNNDLVKEAVEVAISEISPISDVRGSKEYKTLLLGQLIKAHFIEMFENEITSKVLI